MQVRHVILKRVVCVAFLFFVAAVARNVLMAKEINATSENRFYSAVKRTDLAVALFYDQAESKSSLSMFKTLSKFGNYRDADIDFIKVNVSKSKVSSVAADFKLTTFPAFILFKDGDVVTDDKGTTAVLTGNVSKSQLKGFIDDHLGDEIENAVEEKREERKRRAEIRAANASYGYYDPWYGYGYGYPYGGWGGYGYRGGWGVGLGLGWGGGWGRGRRW